MAKKKPAPKVEEAVVEEAPAKEEEAVVEAPAKKSLVVAKGKACTSCKGMLKPGMVATDNHFAGGKFDVERLVELGVLVWA